MTFLRVIGGGIIGGIICICAYVIIQAPEFESIDYIDLDQFIYINE